MGYQALLFSPDEKLARVVSQVFTELEFTVELAQEPFGAVKRLMAQHFDAIVVDCENEQNASLLFKSARNSSFNQSSLAIALVQDQAGVAKAYRIGANLVLTKPINVEQAKGTLRVARGLLRKSADAAGGSAHSVPGPTMPATAAPESAGNSSWPASRGTPASAPSPGHPELLEFEAALPRPDGFPAPVSAGASAGVSTMTAAAKVHVKPAVPASPAPIRITIADEPAQETSSAFTSPGSAAAPARAKKVTTLPAKENKTVATEPAHRSQAAAPILDSVAVINPPTFAALGESEVEDSGGFGGRKKILIAVVIVFVLAALGYVFYGKPGKSGPATPASPPVSAPQGLGKQNSQPQDTAQPAGALAPMSSPEIAPSPSTHNRSSSTPQTSTPKTAIATSPDVPSPGAAVPPATRIALTPASHSAGSHNPESHDLDSATKQPDSPALLVKSNPSGTKTQVQDSAPPPPSPLAVASAAVPSDDSALRGVLSSASSTIPKPALATARISQGVSQGLLIKRVQPKYPQAALAMHTQGAVQIEATIDKEGNVTNLKVLSGDSVLAKAALEAVRQWRYKPYYLDGEPVDIETQITVTFKAN